MPATLTSSADGEPPAAFTLDDLKRQLEQITKPSKLLKMLDLLPKQLTQGLTSPSTLQESRRFIGTINAMTNSERTAPQTIDAGRCARIAAGAGVSPQEVQQLLRQFKMMKTMIGKMKS